MEISSQLYGTLPGERMSPIFLAVLMWLAHAHNAGTSILVSRFLIKGIDPCIFVKSVYLLVERVWGFLFYHLADVP